MVHLLARMGNSKEALILMTEELKNIEQATNFCKEQDDAELWEVECQKTKKHDKNYLKQSFIHLILLFFLQNLIQSSLNKPDFITYLLQNIGTAIDPKLLVRRIAPGLPIPGLKNSLGKMMKDYRLQVNNVNKIYTVYVKYVQKQFGF